MTMTATSTRSTGAVTTRILERNPNMVALIVAGRTVAVLGHDEVRSLRLGTKTRWTAQLKARVTALVQHGRAREAALRMMARRAHTRDELQRGLRKLKYATACVTGTLDALERDGWIDDAQCAAARVAQWERTTTARKPRSATWMVAKLVAAGIEPDVAEQCVARGMSSATERRSAEEALATALKAGKSLRAALAALSRRGFAPELLEELAVRHEERDGA
jgi:regulatory protein